MITNPMTTPVACITWRRSGHCTRWSSRQLPCTKFTTRLACVSAPLRKARRRLFFLRGRELVARRFDLRGDADHARNRGRAKRLWVDELVAVGQLVAADGKLRLGQLDIWRGVADRSRGCVLPVPAPGRDRLGTPSPPLLRPFTVARHGSAGLAMRRVATAPACSTCAAAAARGCSACSYWFGSCGACTPRTRGWQRSERLRGPSRCFRTGSGRRRLTAGAILNAAPAPPSSVATRPALSASARDRASARRGAPVPPAGARSPRWSSAPARRPPARPDDRRARR